MFARIAAACTDQSLISNGNINSYDVYYIFFSDMPAERYIYIKVTSDAGHVSFVVVTAIETKLYDDFYVYNEVIYQNKSLG